MHTRGGFPPWRRAGLALRNLWTRGRFERELDAELEATRAHLEDERLAAGATPAAARRAAALQLGGVEQIKESVRAARAGAAIEQLGRDCRHALRGWRRAPAFATVAILTLAIGIGGMTAMFSVVEAVSLRPLRYPAAVRLVHLSAVWPGGSGNLSYPDFVALTEAGRAFESVAAYEPWGGVALSGAGTPVHLNPNFVTADYFPLLGARARTGRLFTGAENSAGSAGRVAVLSDGFWRRQFGGDSAVVGSALRLNDLPYLVVGILDPGFVDLGLAEGGPPTDVWLPAGAAQELLGQAPLSDPYRIYWGLARLRPALTLKQAQLEADAVAARMERDLPLSHQGYGLRVEPLDSRVHGPLRRPAWLVLAATGTILLLACVNLAVTLLVRLGQRRAELAVRASLGASTRRLVVQLLVEAGLLAAVGSAGGLGLAWGLVRLLEGWLSRNVTALVQVRMSGWALVCAAALAVVTGLLIGLAPALATRRMDLRAQLAAAGARATPRRSRFRRSLVAVEVALSMVLLVGAGLMLRSFERLISGPVGYDAAALLTFALDLTGQRYASPETRAAFAGALEHRLGAVPGVRSVTLLGPSMLGNATWVTRVFPAAAVPRSANDFVMLFRHSVNPGALANLGIPLLRGREFTAADRADSPLVAVISASVARQLWPDQDAVGMRLQRPDASLPSIEVVGVAADALHRHRYSLDDLAAGLPPGAVGAQRDIYLPYAQRANPGLTLALRLATAPDGILPAVRTALAELDPDLPLRDVRMQEERLAAQEGAAAAFAILFGAFAGFALFLAGLGVYGVAAQTARAHRKEMGVRLALGARPAAILRQVAGAGVALAAVGLATGGLTALIVGRALAGLLVGVDVADPATLAAVAMLLLAVTAVAAYLPARAALRGGALAALREE